MLREALFRAGAQSARAEGDLAYSLKMKACTWSLSSRPFQWGRGSVPRLLFFICKVSVGIGTGGGLDEVILCEQDFAEGGCLPKKNGAPC